MVDTMTPMERIMTTAAFKEPDRVPFLLLLTTHGALELGLSIEEYFSSGKNVAEGQILMQKKYGHDCYSPTFYSALETEAWGGTVLYSDNGPPQAGEPIIQKAEDILTIVPPKIDKSMPLHKSLEAIELLKNKSMGEIPIIGLVISPFSIPIIQMGFDKYIELIYDNTDFFKKLMQKNLDFSAKWANAQLESGADFICYFDPVASSQISPISLYEKWGLNLEKDFIKAVNGPVVTHLASGKAESIINLISETGSIGVGISTYDDIGIIKESCKEKLVIIGNLNGVEMRRWSEEEAESIVKEVILKGGKGGGFILSDNHGEIPFQVPENVLLAISRAVHTWGYYPLTEK